MPTATLDRTTGPTTAPSVATETAPTGPRSGSTDPATRKAVVVGLAFLTATFTFAIGNALIHSYFSSAHLAQPHPHRRRLPSGLRWRSRSLSTVW